jgi:hypothetical protein
VGFNATIEPSDSPESCLLKSIRIGVGRVNNVVQLHHDVGADRCLELDKKDNVSSELSQMLIYLKFGITKMGAKKIPDGILKLQTTYILFSVNG